jgi:hypothetical protein
MGGSSLVCKEGCTFSMGCCMREPYLHYLLKSATLLSHHYNHLNVRTSIYVRYVYFLYYAYTYMYVVTYAHVT